jgi:hypothetical protein
MSKLALSQKRALEERLPLATVLSGIHKKG